MYAIWLSTNRRAALNPKSIRSRTPSKGSPWISTTCYLPPLDRMGIRETSGVVHRGHFSDIHGGDPLLGISRRCRAVYRITGHRRQPAARGGLVCPTRFAAWVGAAVRLRRLCRFYRRSGPAPEWTLIDRSATTYQGCDQRVRAAKSAMADRHTVSTVACSAAAHRQRSLCGYHRPARRYAAANRFGVNPGFLRSARPATD